MREADVLIIGAGPAGLHAALKAAVLNHTVIAVDKGRRFSRVSQAPAIANLPGHPGISGDALLERGRKDLDRFEDVSGKRLVALEEEAEVIALDRTPDGFRARVAQGGGEWEARAKVAILATGCVDRKPGLSEYAWKGHQTLAPFLHKRLVGYCLLCEGWSLDGKRVAVVGHSSDAVGIADDVCEQFNGEVHLLTDGRMPARPTCEGVRVDEREVAGVAEEDGALRVAFADGAGARFDKALFALGWHRVESALAVGLGARTDAYGHVVTDENREVLGADGEPIRGLYAVGDVRAGAWKQIPLAWADAELAVISAYAQRLPAAHHA